VHTTYFYDSVFKFAKTPLLCGSYQCLDSSTRRLPIFRPNSSFSDQDGWVGIAVENDDSYFSISAGSDSNESYFYYESNQPVPTAMNRTSTMKALLTAIRYLSKQ